MGEVGRWDPALFEAYRRAPRRSAEKGQLLNALIRTNEPLAKIIAAQLAGRTQDRKSTRRRGPRLVRGADQLEWDEVMYAARIGLMKALAVLNPKKGSLAGFLKYKIYYELQCAVERSSIIKTPRDFAAKPVMEYVEDDTHLGRLTRGEEDFEDALLERIDEELLERAEARRAAEPPPEPPPAPPVDTRPALDVFLEDHCRFAPAARAATSSVRGRYVVVAAVHGEAPLHHVLFAALRTRGVRETTMRVPWESRPVRGLTGVSLQNA